MSRIEMEKAHRLLLSQNEFY